MPIYDQGYERWNGELQKHPARWWPIVRQGILQFAPQRKYLILLGLAAIATLAHPHIVSVYSVGEERGVHFYAMQLVEGPTLQQVLHGLAERGEEARGDVEARRRAVLGDHDAEATGLKAGTPVVGGGGDLTPSNQQGR